MDSKLVSRLQEAIPAVRTTTDRTAGRSGWEGAVKAILLAGCMVLLASAVTAESRVEVRAFPRFAPEKGNVRVTAVVQPHPDNRMLVIEADCDDYYRASERQLDGENAPRVHVLMLANLPAGDCELTARVRSGRSERGRASRTFTVTGRPAEAPPIVGETSGRMRP
jgi:hypothetical protein